MRHMYSAVPGRVYMAMRAYTAHGEKELSISKGDKVKGKRDSERSGFFGMHCVDYKVLIHLSSLFSLSLSVECGRGGVLGGHSEGSYRLVPLRLCGGGGSSH